MRAPRRREPADITALPADSRIWNALVAHISDTARLPNAEAMAEKDLYVTRVVKEAVAPSAKYPETQVLFKGGTSLSKAYSLLNRFSEDIDVNVVPPSGFGGAKRRNARKEIQERLEKNLPFSEIAAAVNSNFSSFTISYPSAAAQPGLAAPTPGGPTYGRILVEVAIREQPPGLFEKRTIRSFVGEAAAEIDPGLLDEYPDLRPFEVFAASPVVAVVDKLDAMHWRSESDDPSQTSQRPRDIYDLAALLSKQEVRDMLDSSLVARIHAEIVEKLPAGMSYRRSQRPADSFAESKAFEPGHPACEALRTSYPTVRDFVFSDDDWIEFDNAIEIIRSWSHLI